MSEIFEKGDNKKEKDFEKEKDVLYKEIGKMKIENERLKKNKLRRSTLKFRKNCLDNGGRDSIKVPKNIK
jgi:hypothetical protein